VRSRRITCDELATRIQKPLGQVVAILEELQAAGLAERDGGNHWRLTEAAEARFGACLRDVSP
jgi:DNA-binding IclR family transcriptional regulator